MEVNSTKLILPLILLMGSTGIESAWLKVGNTDPFTITIKITSIGGVTFTSSEKDHNYILSAIRMIMKIKGDANCVAVQGDGGGGWVTMYGIGFEYEPGAVEFPLTFTYEAFFIMFPNTATPIMAKLSRTSKKVVITKTSQNEADFTAIQEYFTQNVNGHVRAIGPVDKDAKGTLNITNWLEFTLSLDQESKTAAVPELQFSY